ncbi:MAG TPA: hypothetical protein VFS97_00265 [Nitrososphaeraceae archaeon]|nr:hypothetical protein [Nitrososphaeraceae archaeon]
MRDRTAEAEVEILIVLVCPYTSGATTVNVPAVLLSHSNGIRVLDTTYRK